MPRLRPLSKPLAAATTLALTLVGGCGYLSPGNPMASNNEFNYPSTATMPQTVVLRDLRTDQVLYTWEIPVDQKLHVRFHEGKGDPGSATPDQCVWLFYPITRWNPPLEDRHTFNVPPASACRLDLFTRPSPELPADMKPAEIPQPPADLPPIK
ncbi:MAG: hypothetical protein Q8L55_11360 [Phycisphaerales bacterium]|nr:hypothetical protein [Phycisphaerales bacterium]